MSDASGSDAEGGEHLTSVPRPADLEADLATPAHQQEVQLDHLTFTSLMCSGNMARAEIDEHVENEYNVWTQPDCAGTPHATTCRSWFYFGVRGGRVGETIGITVMNSNIQRKLYGKGYKPCTRSLKSSPKWAPMTQKVHTSIDDDADPPDYQIRWEVTFIAEEEVQFAFCYPHSMDDGAIKFTECQRLANLPALAEKMYFHREVLTRSIQGRPMELITISSRKGLRSSAEANSTPELFPDSRDADRARAFRGKRVVFISARVHPGETPASHVFNGALDFLMRPSDPRAAALREHFVFKLVPFLNPDGVARGHYRTDTLGQNLNRFYHEPDPVTQPSIYAIKNYMLQRCREGILHAFIDLHAHATKRGIFVFGNNLDTTERLIETVLYAKLISMNSPHFEFACCNFTEKNMKRKDKRDGLSKTGSARVTMYREMGLTHIYTLECNYNSGLSTNAIKPAKGSNSARASPARDAAVASKRYSIDDFEGVGRAMLTAMLDQEQLNTWSRLENSRHRSLDGVRKWVATFVERSRRRESKGIISAECGDAVETDWEGAATGPESPTSDLEPEPEPAAAVSSGGGGKPAAGSTARRKKAGVGRPGSGRAAVTAAARERDRAYIRAGGCNSGAGANIKGDGGAVLSARHRQRPSFATTVTPDAASMLGAAAVGGAGLNTAAFRLASPQPAVVCPRSEHLTRRGSRGGRRRRGAGLDRGLAEGLRHSARQPAMAAGLAALDHRPAVTVLSRPVGPMPALAPAPPRQ